MEGRQGKDRVNKAGEGKPRKERAFWANTVERIMQGALPMNPPATIHRDATDLVDECVKDFMGIVVMESHEQRRKEGKDKMTGLHVIKAMEELAFDNYVGPLTEHLRRYREVTGYVGHGNKRATAPGQAATGQMAPQPSDSALGPPLGGITVQGQLPAADVTTATEEMAPQPSVVVLGVLPPNGVTVQGQAPPAAVTTAAGDMEPAPLLLLGTALGQPPPQKRARGASSGDARVSSSSMPPACDDEC
uniref:Transcription factor CBF/NF-Y/archaeal histone domain-containing protein n=1 Tax=Hordeum vulgare subsp. vulgare TaxID=112509 RepID=A0A8I6YM47_HORVV